MHKDKFIKISEEEHIKGMISMALIGTSVIFFFVLVVGVLEWLFWR